MKYVAITLTLVLAVAGCAPESTEQEPTEQGSTEQEPTEQELGKVCTDFDAAFLEHNLDEDFPEEIRGFADRSRGSDLEGAFERLAQAFELQNADPDVVNNEAAGLGSGAMADIDAMCATVTGGMESEPVVVESETVPPTVFPEPEPTPEPDGSVYADYEHDLDVVWKEAGVRFTLTRIVLANRSELCDPYGPYEESLDAPEVCDTEIYPGETIVGLDMKVRNRSGQDIEFYPDQATLVIGNEQVEGELLGPDVIGGTIRAGTDVEGQAWWLSDKSSDAIENLGAIRFVTSPPDYYESLEPITGSYEEINLEVGW